MSNVEIIPFSPEHAKAFGDLNLWWLREYFVVEPLDEKVLADPQHYIIEPGGHIYLAQVEGEIVGTISLIKDGETYELSKMAVHPDYQGYGLGRKLMQAALDKAQALGVASIYLLTNTKLAVANNLYQRFGFIEVEPSDYDRAHYARCNTKWVYHFDESSARVG